MDKEAWLALVGQIRGALRQRGKDPEICLRLVGRKVKLREEDHSGWHVFTLRAEDLDDRTPEGLAEEMITSVLDADGASTPGYGGGSSSDLTSRTGTSRIERDD